jgi:hypothetical protein
MPLSTLIKYASCLPGESLLSCALDPSPILTTNYIRDVEMVRRLSFDELVDREARGEARELIRINLEKANLPLPKDSAMDKHVDELLKASPNILANAKTRVEAQKTVFAESFTTDNSSPPDVVEIEL